MEAFDAQLRMPRAKLPPHPGFENLRRVRIAEDQLAPAEKPADLDQGAGVGGRACERREAGDDDVASLHHREVRLVCTRAS